MRLLSIIFVLLYCCNLYAAPYASWVEFGPEQQLQVRAIVAENEACPQVLVDGDQRQLLLRAAAGRHYAVNSCELTLSRQVKSVSLADRALPLPKARPSKIVVIGDTGCRLKESSIQACNDVDAWPFKKIVEHAAAWQPDLVIHVGDYLYREMPCPNGDKGCQGSSYGQRWQTWQADFFKPAQQLMAAAPWVVARGNHESCQRAGEGWFRFLDPYPYQQKCTDFTPPYRVVADGLTLVMFDSSGAKYSRNDKQHDIYSEQFEQVAALATEPSWLITHQPIWALFKKAGLNISTNTVLQAAWRATGVPKTIEGIVSGHFHEASVFSFAATDADKSPRPPQIISGNGGTELHQPVEFAKFLQQKLDGLRVKAGFNLFRFGYATVTPLQQGWRWQFRDADGMVVASCDIDNKVARCERV